MTSDCRLAENIINRWENEGSASSEDAQFLGSHVSGCAACAGRFSSLLPLIRRDAGIEADTWRGAPVYSEALTQRILGGVQAGGIPGRRKISRLLFILPAAAVLAAALGLTVLPKLLNSIKGSDSVTVTFRLTAPEADSVLLVGDFTGWDTDGIKLEDNDRDGVWETEVSLPKGNIYKYNFIVNGDLWITDPRSQAVIEDGFGGDTSLLQI